MYTIFLKFVFSLLIVLVLICGTTAEPIKPEADSTTVETTDDTDVIATDEVQGAEADKSSDKLPSELETMQNNLNKMNDNDASEEVKEKAGTESKEGDASEDKDDTINENEMGENSLNEEANAENPDEDNQYDEYAYEYLLPSKLRRAPPYAVEIDNEDGEQSLYAHPEYDLDFPPTVITPGVFVMCYTLKLEDIMKRCKGGIKWGSGVYIPAFNRTGEKTNSEGDEKSFYELFDPIWYDTIQQLKNETKLSVYGLIFEMDDLPEKFNELVKFTNVFDGFLLDWEYQQHACYTKVPELNTTKEIRYFMGNQDRTECDTAFDDFVNTPNRKTTPIPSHITPVFPCFDGNEGRCYRSFVIFRNETCNSTKQRYYFNPWGPASQWFFFRDACGGKMPPHDFISGL